MNEAEKRLGALGINDVLFEEQLQNLREEVESLKKKLTASKSQITRLKNEKEQLLEQIQILQVEREAIRERDRASEDGQVKVYIGRAIDQWNQENNHLVDPGTLEKLKWYASRPRTSPPIDQIRAGLPAPRRSDTDVMKSLMEFAMASGSSVEDIGRLAEDISRVSSLPDLPHR